MEAPQNPAGVFEPGKVLDPRRIAELIGVIEAAPTALSDLVAGLSDDQLERKYRNWTIRQIVHHLADSHIQSYTRFKWALTEDRPTIKPYDESRWAELEEARTGDIGASLAILQGIHARWGRLLRSMTEEQFARSFFHPETNQTVALSEALSLYAWHGQHHTAQIAWIRDHEPEVADGLRAV